MLVAAVLALNFIVSPAFEAELVLDREVIPANGVCTGVLIVTNTTDETRSFHTPLRHDLGDFWYRIERDGGPSCCVTRNHLFLIEGIQGLTLAPDDHFLLPVCLLKSDGEHLFAQPGEYTVRAYVISGREEYVCGTARLTVASGTDDLAPFVEEMSGLSRLYEAFHRHPMFEEWKTLTGPSNREYSILMVYQYGGSRIGRAIFKDEPERAGDLAADMLWWAEYLEVGIPIWRSIDQEHRDRLVGVPVQLNRANRVYMY